MSKTWQQTAVYDPTNPDQRNRVVYASPGGYTSYYWNRVTDAGVLNGLGAGFGSLPQIAQVGIVATIAAVAGYFGWQAVGDKYVKPALRPALKRIGLAGGRRRR